MSTREERAEDRRQRAKMARLYPACRWCRKPCVAGQLDGEGVPSHYGCQIAFLALTKPSPREVPMNPHLPHHRKDTRE